jgi:ABC-2 type transport system ATP-binding protein/lipopolysaccharide transport system ATP-binding protein
MTASLALENITIDFPIYSGGGRSLKTTLLRAMAGVYEPTLGRVSVSGRVSTIFDFTLGLDFDATGYENISLQGMLLGLTRKSVAALTDEIAAFTGLGAYLDMPIRTYSAGMLTRLAFAVATSIDPEVLLMDEWIATGDAAFFEKAEARLQALVERAGILVLASHNANLLRRYCNVALWLEHGRIRLMGPVDDVLKAAGLAAAELEKGARAPAAAQVG